MRVAVDIFKTSIITRQLKDGNNNTLIILGIPRLHNTYDICTLQPVANFVLFSDFLLFLEGQCYIS